MENVYVVNGSAELSKCRGKWEYNETYECWCLEDILYTQESKAPRYQRMSIFVPATYMEKAENGEICITAENVEKYNAATAPVVFENNASGYSQMEHTWLGGPRNYAEQYLKRGMVYVSCGCRGRETKADDGTLIGKSPATLVDFKTAIRFLRHNKKEIPGNLDHIISVGWSAGGAMSSLLGCTGNSPLFENYLKENGAFMDETDDVYASQVYCPIIDLEHADLAYEWQYRTDIQVEPSPFSPGGELSGFQQALSGRLSDRFITYFNAMNLVSPETGETLVIEEDGRSGSGYEYMMKALEDSASVYLNKLAAGKLDVAYSVEQYLDGDYTYQVIDGEKLMQIIHAMEEGAKDGPKEAPQDDGKGEENVFEGHGTRVKMPEMPMKDLPGRDKKEWLVWDGKTAHIKDLDAYVAEHRGRMKTCPSFDFLENTSGENQEFGDEKTDFMHFDPMAADAIAELKEEFPEEYEKYYGAYAAVAADEALAERCYLINPYNYIGTKEACNIAPHFRVNVGASDADTSFMVSMILSLKLAAAGIDSQYHLYWDQPHCEADYPGEVTDWIESITL